MNYTPEEKAKMDKLRFNVYRRCPTQYMNGVQHYHADELINISRQELERAIKYGFQDPDMEITIKVNRKDNK